MYLMVLNLLACGLHLHNLIVSLRLDAWVHKTSLIATHSIDVPAPQDKKISRRVFFVVVRSIDFVSFYDFSIEF